VLPSSVLTSLASAAEAGAPTLAEVLAEARTRKLAEDPEWLHLIHYNTGFFGGTTSEVERGHFFLSPRGRHDHEAELVATLTAFFRPVVAGHEDEHPLCRFPARRDWLESALHFRGNAPPMSCPELDRALERLAPTGVSLVYASTYLGNPASAFGHAFLHLTTRAGDAAPPSSAARDAADRGIEYRAVTDTKNPLLYALKGVAGLFPGLVETQPYDLQARRYTAEQGRDVWEYELALTPREVTFLMLHLWELRTARIDYFYLTRNCAFEDLALLETAAPRLVLLPGLDAIVSPIDTVRAIARVPGLVRRVAYRPSLETRLHTRLRTLTVTEQLMVRRLVLDPAAPWPSVEKIAENRHAVVLDAAIREVEAHASKDLESPGTTAAKRTWQALMLRQNGVTVPEPPLDPDWDARPDFGHRTMRALLGSGVTSQYGHSFGSVGFRLALHDLTDPADGEPELSQVVMLDTKLRFDLANRALTLDTLTFADLLALNPIVPADPLVSFRARAFGVRLHDRDCPDCFAHGLDGSIGGTVATASERVAFFVMADAYVAFLPHLSGLDATFVRLGVGPFGGVRLRWGETVGLLTGTVSYLPGEKLADTFDLRFTVKSTLARNVALGLEMDAQPLSVEGQLSSYVYF
jgi:hypothetical protein